MSAPPKLECSGHLLLVDPPCKEYLSTLHSLLSSPTPSNAKSKKLYTEARMHLLVEFLFADPARVAKIQEAHASGAAMDRFITGHAGGSLPADDGELIPPDLFSFLLDDFAASDTKLLVSRYAVGGLEKVVAEWVESNVWSRVDEEKEEEKKKQKAKRKR
ncbi:hypothetical protein TeGR_g10933 [Tetraparma gracilis]|uniref:Uncharacterized protein n=1 Tax=Tetraparma gracilis TaxID=2962635 RepID=A0ABQ6MTV0_9STRA|nr:hypothetical protein TeGR_g10933 [Tetraparma gracilis]